MFQTTNNKCLNYAVESFSKSEKKIKPGLFSSSALSIIPKSKWMFSPMYIPFIKIVSEYDQEIPQSQTADNPVAPRGRAAQPSRDTRKTN